MQQSDHVNDPQVVIDSTDTINRRQFSIKSALATAVLATTGAGVLAHQVTQKTERKFAYIGLSSTLPKQVEGVIYMESVMTFSVRIIPYTIELSKALEQVLTATYLKHTWERDAFLRMTLPDYDTEYKGEFQPYVVKQFMKPEQIADANIVRFEELACLDTQEWFTPAGISRVQTMSPDVIRLYPHAFQLEA